MTYRSYLTLAGIAANTEPLNPKVPVASSETNEPMSEARFKTAVLRSQDEVQAGPGIPRELQGPTRSSEKIVVLTLLLLWYIYDSYDNDDYCYWYSYFSSYDYHHYNYYFDNHYDIATAVPSSTVVVNILAVYVL